MRRRRTINSVVIATAVTAAWSSVALAQFEFWVPPGGVGTWDATNGSLWAPDHIVPGSTNTAVLNGFRYATIASPVPSIQTFRLGDFNDGTLTFSNSTSSLSTSSDSFMGISAQGT